METVVYTLWVVHSDGTAQVRGYTTVMEEAESWVRGWPFPAPGQDTHIFACQER